MDQDSEKKPKRKYNYKPTSNPPGRPTKYEPRFCEVIQSVAREGGSMAAMAEACGVIRPQLYDWADRHEEFSTALMRAKQLEQIYWENLGREGMKAEKFNALVWKVSMQARFRDDYTERKVQEVTGKDGGPIKTETKATIDAAALDPDAREALRAALTVVKKGR